MYLLQHPVVVVVVGGISRQCVNIQTDNMSVVATGFLLPETQAAVIPAYGMLAEIRRFEIGIAPVSHFQHIDNMNVFGPGQLQQVFNIMRLVQSMMHMYIARIPAPRRQIDPSF